MNICFTMRSRILLLVLSLTTILCGTKAWAQQTLGTINGTVTDTAGASLSDAQVSVTGDNTGLTRTARTQKSGYFEILNLPIGPYTITITHDGFDTAKLPGIVVQEARATTVNPSLKVGQVAESVTINANPLLNATDTTNGYTLDRAQIEATPLATGSFTQLATLAPGVSAQLLGGTGSNAGLGNQPIWANGQRDSSNTFTVNGVDVTNLFNGQSTSQTESQRENFDIGENGQPGGGTQTSTAVAGSNGNGLASPPPDFIQELRVNTSMYDAQQGTTSGAHIDVNTISGGNTFHGSAWGTRGTDALNAAPFFFKQDGVVPATPQLHRYTAGGTVGGPVIKNKLFFFLGYQHTASDDQYAGVSQFQVPFGLSNDRSTAGITSALESYYHTSGTAYKAISSYNSAAVALLNAKLPNGDFLIPSADADGENQLSAGRPDVNLVSTSRFKADQATAALDYNVTSTDHLSAKYYYQHAPAFAPFGVSQTEGFPQNEDSGAQVAALDNNLILGPKITWEQRFGFSRQKVYSNFSPQLKASDGGINIPGFSNFPGLELKDFAYDDSKTTNVGPSSAFVNAGYFENRFTPSSNIIFSLGSHTISAGASYSYNQLNIRNDRTGTSDLTISNFPNFLAGKLRSGSILLGDSQRYYRSNDVGGYVQDKWQARPNLSITAGLRYDFNGPFTEKYGNLFNFDPALYSATDQTVTNSGFVCAGNNKNCATPGVSDSTLKGRQWGLGPRVGFAYQPPWNHGTVVIRGGFGINYDRGEYFQYLSPPAAGQTALLGGPFGVTQEPPLVTFQNFSGTLEAPFGNKPLPPGGVPAGASVTQYFNGILPTANQIKSACTATNVYNSSTFACTAIPYVIGDYDVNNKLPYAENWSLDFQWQPRSDLAFTFGYVGNRGRHGVIPLPFNEPQIATPGHPVNGETASYGYQVLASTPTASCPDPNPTNSKAFQNGCALSSEPYNTFSGGNVDLRVPFIGYDPNSTDFKAVGVSAYDSFQTHVEKRMSHGIQFGASYTYSHSLDEQSDVGLFFTGDNPSDLRSSYASSDFDRTHVVTFNYLFALPNLEHTHNLASYFTNGWSLIGLTVLQSGQPFSIYDFSGSVGGQYFGTNIELINPVLPLAPGVTPNQAKTGHSGAFFNSANSLTSSLDATKFQIPLVNPGVNGVPNCDASGGPGGGPLCDVYETNFVPGQRNIFRQAFQKRADVSLQKITQVTERLSARYTFDVYNLTNTPSFDIPTNNITLNPNFGELGGNESGTQVQASGNSAVATPSGPANCVGGAQACAYELYTTPGAKSNSLGVVKNTIGSPRIIQMSLHFIF